MPTEKGFTVEIASRFEGWWRYNASLMCGCFDAAGNRTGFAAAESHVADVGSAPAACPPEIAPDRSLTLETGPCDHLLLYIYIVPHTLPNVTAIEDAKPFDLELRIAWGGRRFRSERLQINQWGGRSLELRIDPPETDPNR